MTKARTGRAAAGQRGVEAAAASPAAIPSFVPPYPPSLLDRLIDWLDRRAVPSWVILFGVGLAAFLVLTLVEWREGGYPPGTFRLLHAMVAAYVPFIVGLIGLLDRSAGRALEQFRVSLQREAEEARLRYELTTLPRTPTILIGTAAAGVIGVVTLRFLGDLHLMEISPTALSSLVFGVVLVATWWITGVFIYHTLRQLRTIYRIYTRHTRIDFFHLSPLYAFSRHTQRTAIAILVFVYIDFLAADPGLRLHPLNLGAGGMLTALAIVAFIGPLGGVHRLMAAEKTRLLDGNARRLEAGFLELQRRMDSLRLTGADDLNKTLSSLELERAALERIPTWPWEPGTIRGLAAAVLLPIALWLIQYSLQRILG